MRNIKFRFYDKTKKRMEYFDSDWYMPDPDYDFDEIQQFTGLLDKAGKEIYEGDIVKCVFATGKEPCKVIQEKGCFWVSQKGMKYLQTEAHDNLYWHNSECEIIGNIYENPELLNVKQ